MICHSSGCTLFAVALTKIYVNLTRESVPLHGECLKPFLHQVSGEDSASLTGRSILTILMAYCSNSDL